jgi:hypothetical protein
MAKDVNIYGPIGGKDLLKLPQMRLYLQRRSLSAPATSGVGGVMSPSMAASAPVTPAGGVRKMATVRRILRTVSRYTGTGVLRRG